MVESGLDTIVLYRPVGRAELALIEQTGWTAFPPRLEHQPFFCSGRGCTRNAGSLAEEMDDFNHAISAP